MSKKQIAIIYGGFSGERVISEKSASVVKEHLSKDRYEAVLVDVTRNGWFALYHENRIRINLTDFSFDFEGNKIAFDAVFNAIHGNPGEDGKIQGYFDMLGIPYNNCGVLASSLSFNKVACNRYLSASGIPVARSFIARRGENIDADEVVKKVGLPCFVKPNDGGSSLGITKVKEKSQILDAIKLAQKEDTDALIESFLDGLEVSCGCMAIDGKPTALGVTEIVPANEFFDFESKYFNKDTQEITPARINNELYDKVMRQTETIYRYLGCKGMIRVDYMICSGDEVFLIEVNTTPGLSEASIIPQQANHFGMTFEQFFSQTIDELFR